MAKSDGDQSIESNSTPSQEAHCSTNNGPVDDELLKRSRSLPLEIPILLLFLSWNLTGTVFQYQILYQTCTVSLGYNETDCSQLGQGQESEHLAAIEREVQKYATKVFTCRAILENIVPALFSLFIGPWSDRYGRKPVLLCSFSGYFFVYSANGIISYISSHSFVSPWLYLFAYIPVSLCGGTCALITVLFCYINDKNPGSNRGFAMARMEAAVFVGLLTGSLTSNYIFEVTSTQFMFFLATALIVLALLYIKYAVTESVVGATENDEDLWTKFGALFEFSHVYDIFSVCFRKRESFNRAIIWLVILSLASQIFVLEGNVTLFYLFTRNTFDWTIAQYNLYAATSTIMQVFGNIIGMYILSKLLGMSEIMIALIAYGSGMTEYIIAAFAMAPWQLYLATVITLLKGVATPLCRSILASTAPSGEIGKIYALTTSLESLAPIGSAPAYTFVYTYTIDTFPGAFNLLSASILLICVLCLLLVYVFNRRRTSITYGPIS